MEEVNKDKDTIIIKKDTYKQLCDASKLCATLQLQNLAYKELLTCQNPEDTENQEILIRKHIVLALHNLSAQAPPDDKYTLQSIRKEICRIRNIPESDIKTNQYVRDIHKYIPMLNIPIIKLRANKKGIKISKSDIKNLMDKLFISTQIKLPPKPKYTSPTNILNRPDDIKYIDINGLKIPQF